MSKPLRKIPPPAIKAEDLPRLESHLTVGSYELYDGLLYLREPAGLEHAAVSSELLARLHTYVRQHKLGIAPGSSAGYVIARNPDTVLEPDVSFLRQDRVPKGWRKFFEGAPDIAGEIMSPSDRFLQTRHKAERYLAAGTRLVWIVQPGLRVIHVIRPDVESVQLKEGDTLTGEDVLPGFSMPVSDVFDW